MKKTNHFYFKTNSKNKYAFTMIEMIFVIVVLGILAAIAVPRFAATRTDAEITKGRADIASIRAAIITERQSRLIKGDSSWISALSYETKLFTGADENQTLLMYGITSGTTSGHWSGTDPAYKFYIGTSECVFNYTSSDGKFLPASGNDVICLELTK